MFIKSLCSNLKKMFFRLIPVYAAIAVIVIIARLILSFAGGVAESGKPPLLHSTVAYISYFSMLALIAVVLTVTVFFIKNVVTDDEDKIRLPRLAASVLATTIFNVAAQLIFFGASMLLTFDGSYFYYHFSSLIPPLAYSPASVYGIPLCLYSLVSFSLIISAIPVILSSCFAFGKRFKRTTPPTVCAVLAFYSLALTVFIILVLSDIPRTSLFTGYLYSGDYAHVIATYLAATISLVSVAVISFFITPLLKKSKK